MKKLIKKIALLFLIPVCISPQGKFVLTGIDVLTENQFEILRGKKVGLITNPTGVNRELKSTADILFEAPNVQLTALFGPEHGIRGDYSAGEYVEFYTDSKTGLPVYSLYGKTRKPTSEMLKGLDVLVYDIQDIGCRSYTYISTMGLAMEAAAENNIEFVVLDRPNPLGGLKVEGNLVEEGYFSFVSQFKIPYVYGLTCGELAKLLNEEGMLSGERKCKLTVVPMFGWERSMSFNETGLQWVPASPHIPFSNSPEYYVSTGIVGELGVISEGVGYTMPFHLLGAKWINADKIAGKINQFNLPGVEFRPITYKPFYGRDEKKVIHGVQLHILDYSKLDLMSIQFLFLEAAYELYPDKNPFSLASDSRISMFDKVNGTKNIRELFTRRMKFADIKDYLNKDVEAFKKLSAKYFIY